MSLPVSKEQFTFVIWSNEYLDWDNYRDAFEEDYSSLTDDEKYQLMCDLNNDYLDDERRNLDIQVGTPIIVIADIGRWDGRHTGYREISSGCIKDCLESQLDGVTWYLETVARKNLFAIDGAAIEAGDKLLTLSTCCTLYGKNETGDQRLVVAAKLLPTAAEEAPYAVQDAKFPELPENK